MYSHSVFSSESNVFGYDLGPQD
uniref:Uncharacterized protein n=1 Tax=Anguilla anguilla TaxID=7936 RepID=A0A0E9TSS1_ANGAN